MKHQEAPASPGLFFTRIGCDLVRIILVDRLAGNVRAFRVRFTDVDLFLSAIIGRASEKSHDAS